MYEKILLDRHLLIHEPRRHLFGVLVVAWCTSGLQHISRWQGCHFSCFSTRCSVFFFLSSVLMFFYGEYLVFF